MGSRASRRDRLGPDPHREAWVVLMERLGYDRVRRPGRRLGQRRHRADGPAEARGTAGHPHQHAGDRSARCLEGSRDRRSHARRSLGRRGEGVRDPGALLRDRRRPTRRRWAIGRRRSTASRTRRSAWRPGCSITTSAATSSSRAPSPDDPGGLSRDDVLDNVTHYWLTNTGVSSARLYWESKLAFFDAKGVEIPVGVTVFPDELYPAPRSWAEKAYPEAHPLQRGRRRRPLRRLGAAADPLGRDPGDLQVTALICL